MASGRRSKEDRKREIWRDYLPWWTNELLTYSIVNILLVWTLLLPPLFLPLMIRIEEQYWIGRNLLGNSSLCLRNSGIFWSRIFNVSSNPGCSNGANFVKYSSLNVKYDNEYILYSFWIKISSVNNKDNTKRFCGFISGIADDQSEGREREKKKKKERNKSNVKEFFFFFFLYAGSQPRRCKVALH